MLLLWFHLLASVPVEILSKNVAISGMAMPMISENDNKEDNKLVQNNAKVQYIDLLRLTDKAMFHS